MSTDLNASTTLSPISPARRFGYIGITLLLLIVVVALLAEGVYRLVAPPPEVFDLSGLHEFRPDREWLYRGRAGAAGEIFGTYYEINADGFRGPVHDRTNPENRKRLVVMGDSIAFGFGVDVEETFPRVIETLLASRLPEANVEVVNLGVGGYNAWNEARLLDDVGLDYDPDLVLVQFSINDLNDPTVHFSTQTRLAMDAIPDKAFPDPSRSQGLSAGRQFFTRACNLSRLCAVLRLRASEDEKPLQEGADAVRAFRAPVEQTDRVEWQWLEERYLEMAAASKTAGAKFGILAFPYRSQLGGRGEHPVNRHLRELAERNGWLFIDPLPAYRVARARGNKLFIDLWHPSVAGHTIAARETARVLIEQAAF